MGVKNTINLHFSLIPSAFTLEFRAVLPKIQKSIQPSSVCLICVSSIIFYLIYNIDLLNLSNFKSELYIIIILSQFNVLAIIFFKHNCLNPGLSTT